MEDHKQTQSTALTEHAILDYLDNFGTQYPSSFFPDFRNDYLVTAGTKMSLFSNATRWTIVIEIIGYHNRSLSLENKTFYFGNCLSNMTDDIDGRKISTNIKHEIFITDVEFNEMSADFELLDDAIDSVVIRDQKIKIEKDLRKYSAKGINVRSDDNPHQLIDFVSLTRYLVEEHFSLFTLTREEQNYHIPQDLPKIMELKEWYHQDYDYLLPYKKYVGVKPSDYYTFKTLAKVLVTKDTSLYQPTMSPNTNWRINP